MAMVVSAILGSFFAVMNVAILLFIIFGVFAILGMGLFGGCFFRCEGLDLGDNLVWNEEINSTVPVSRLIHLYDKENCNQAHQFESYYEGTNFTIEVSEPKEMYAYFVPTGTNAHYLSHHHRHHTFSSSSFPLHISYL